MSRLMPSAGSIGRGFREVEGAPEEPYFCARLVGGRVEVSGTPTCQLGHRLPSSTEKRPDGIFAGWLWDGVQLEVSNDRYGFYPLYYSAGQQHVAVSTSLYALLARGVSRDLDEAALSVFLRLGFFIGDDTPFASIRTVPPNTDFVWRPHSLRVQGRWALGRSHGLTRTQAMDAYIELFRRAMQKRLSHEATVAVPISGGRDSRHILLALCESGRLPSVTVTVRHPLPLRSEHPEAQALTAQLGLRHVVLDQIDSVFRSTQRIILRQNLCSLEHAWILPMVGYLRSRAGVIFDGIGGDVLSAGLFLDSHRLRLFQHGRLSELAEDLCGREASLPLLGPRLSGRLGGTSAFERVRRELERHREAPNPVGSFYFWNRTRRCIAQSPYRLLDDVPLVFSPYLDHELYDLLAGLPASMLLDHQFHTDTIQRAYPQTTAVAYARKGASVPGRSTPLTEFVRHMLGFSLRRIPSRVVSEPYLLPRLLRCLLDARYSESAEWLGRQALYLWALEDAIGDGSSRWSRLIRLPIRGHADQSTGYVSKS